ncbi:uncharacterized protein LOC115622443 [Scaptodrosophila lebanonensis]|uniref:Uncharacterized protein LOC115622443 n=1 Tax=Drosophila lebanonensis TaxID=7225 RepID=A0A6J2T8C4_DROLE|nr:uncharacterized protein LOC115622443 [Scaptodrosophila lebanonensis]
MSLTPSLDAMLALWEKQDRKSFQLKRHQEKLNSRVAFIKKLNSLDGDTKCIFRDLTNTLCKQFDFYLGIKFPFELKPMFNSAHPGLVMLHAGDVCHDALIDGYLHRKAMHDWLKCEIDRSQWMFRQEFGIFFSSTYEPEDRKCLYSLNCSFRAQEKQELKTITMKYMPMLEFEYNPWLLPQSGLMNAIPLPIMLNDDRIFLIRTSAKWQEDLRRSENNIPKITRLMQELRYVYNMQDLSNYMIEMVVLLEISNINWKQDFGDVFIGLWEKLVEHLKSGELKTFLQPKLNIFRNMTPSVLKDYYYAAAHVLDKLKQLKSAGKNVDKKVLSLFNMDKIIINNK